jgi:PAS domain S-box-containing protein
LQRSRDRLSMAMEATNDGMWDWKLDTNDIYFDVRFYTMLGYEPFEFPGAFNEWMSRIHPDDIGYVKSQLNTHLEGRSEQWSIEYRFLSKDGSWIWVLNRGKVFDRNDDGKAMRMVGTHSDMTFRKKTELSLKQKNDELILAEGNVKLANQKLTGLNDELRIRNNELQLIITEQKKTEEELIAAREKAMESDRLKSAFLANISHEIRTPMNGIIGFSELLQGEDLSSESRSQYINIIIKSSEQLLHIINDIVDISKIEANQIMIEPRDLSLKVLFEELVLFFQKEKNNIGKSHIQVYMEGALDSADIVIHTDESRLRQILMNLISNALKFTDRGAVSFGYRLTYHRSIEFFVKDSGIGIASELQSVIFKRFYQLDNDLTRNFGGTGLGLSICEGLVKLLGGNIWLTSERQKGSVFYFTLPLKLSDKQMKHPDVSKSDDNYHWKGYTILIVEDDDINQEFLSAILLPTHASVLKVSTGEDAVAICSSNSDIHIILMDIRLPKMNGYEAFIKIRKIMPNVVVIAQTAFALTEDSAYCIEIGFDDFIAKPINRKNLLSLINRHLMNFMARGSNV